MGSYLGDAILKKLAHCDLSRVAEHNHDTSESITLKNIYERTLTVAANLKDLNLKEDDIIAFYSRNNSYISGIAFGCNLNGNAWCPFDIIQDNLDYLLGYIRPTILIYDEEFKIEVKDSLNRLEMCVKELIFGNPSLENSVENVLLKPQNIKSFVPKDLSKLKSADHLISCISFTSGSTGVPKAVPITHSMFINQINAVAYLDEFNSKNIMSPSGIRWIAQLFIMFLPIFLNTKKTFSGKNPDPVNMCDAIHKWKVSAILTANSMLKAIFNHYESTPGYDFSSLEYLLSGGEPPCASMKSRFIEILPTIKISQGYGITDVEEL
uniref:AMP-dependent synthetase/ligase domain-containing protein n=1 Tax=Megaselia scalaris TaxID=36166 RepID=T1GLM7_MEGSC